MLDFSVILYYIQYTPQGYIEYNERQYHKW